MQITFNIPEFTRNERNLLVTYYTSPPLESPDVFWMTRDS